MNISDFKGKVLSFGGYDQTVVLKDLKDDIDIDDYKYSNCVLSVVRLNNKNYMFYEDEDDGYRSYLVTDIKELVHYKIQNEFRPFLVKCKYVHTDQWTGEHDEGLDLWEFIDYITEEPVLVIGTDHSDSYYPLAINVWKPQNIFYNRNNKHELEDQTIRS